MDGTEGLQRIITQEGARFLVLEDWVERLFEGGAFLPPSRVAASRDLKRTGSRRVSLVTLRDGGCVVVKHYPDRRGVEGCVRRLLPGAATLEWRHGRALALSGLPCAEPLAVGRAPSGGQGAGGSILVTAALENARDLRDLQDSGALGADLRRGVARALGRLARRLHDVGLLHEDPHAGNFMVRDAEGATEVIPIDLRRLRQGLRLGMREHCRNLLLFYRSMGISVSRSDRLRFLESYLGASSTHAERRDWAREIENRIGRELRCYRKRRSRAAWGENTRFTRRRHGDVSWHLRRSLVVPALERLLEDPELAFREPSVVLKEGRSSTVVAWGDWVVKRVNQKRWRNRVLDRLRAGRAPRALRRAFRLEISGIPAAAVAAAGQRTEAGLVTRGYLVCAWIRDARHADVALAERDAAGRPALLDAIGSLVARLHRAGLAHRDLKAGNVLVTPEGGLCLVDLDGLREVGAVTVERAARDLARLLRDLRGGITPDEEGLLFAAYARGREGVRAPDLATRVEGALRAARRARPAPSPRPESGG